MWLNTLHTSTEDKHSWRHDPHKTTWNMFLFQALWDPPSSCIFWFKAGRKTKSPSGWRTSERLGRLTTWVAISMQAGSSIEKRLRHVPSFFQLLGGRDVARTHTHTHTHSPIYTNLYRLQDTKLWERQHWYDSLCPYAPVTGASSPCRANGTHRDLKFSRCRTGCCWKWSPPQGCTRYIYGCLKTLLELSYTQPGLRQTLRSLSYRESYTTLHKHGLCIIPDTYVLWNLAYKTRYT